MNVIKRNQSREIFSPEKILARIKTQSEGLKVNADEVAIKVIGGFSDGITTSELDNYAAETAATMSTRHPDYSTLAARIAVTSLHKETPDTFSDAIVVLNCETGLLDPHLVALVMNLKATINAKIDHNKDFNYDYFGLKTLMRSYLLKANDKIVERPQYMIMRVALGIWGANLEEAFKTYDLMSDMVFTHATPTLFNAGTRKPQLSSCFLLGNKGDSLEGLFGTIKDVASISKWAGGIGLHIHDVRAKGTKIEGTGGESLGLLPMLKTYNEVARWINQGGKRNGSFSMYLEPWHKDIFQFLDIRKNHGKEELRARDLFPALWVNDLFMQRVEANEHWTLFCPHEVLKATGIKLQDLYGDAFREAYEALENNPAANGKKILGRDLWNAILVSQQETGTPYMGYKDAVNTKSNQKNLGTIKSSNLCIEIVEYSDEKEQAVCNLASLALPKFLTNGQVDHQKLYDVVYQVTRNLNRVIDVNYYPTPETERSNKRHRPIGIGVQGLADLFAMMKLPFDSDEAKKINVEIFETIYCGFLRGSCDLAQEEGPYETFEGSPASKGELQFDMWGVTPSDRWDWEGLKRDIAKHGLRNSLGVALMPTASTGQILGNNECFEPFNSNLSTRRTLAGEFIVVNKHLIKDLEELGLWNTAMENKLKANYGSIQPIPEIPKELKDRYKTVYEIKQKDLLDMAADRGAFIDQTQSMNVFMDGVTVAKLSSMHFYGWKKGLKTGMYYLRTKPAANAIQFTLDNTEAKEYTSEEAIACSLDNPDACEACGS